MGCLDRAHFTVLLTMCRWETRALCGVSISHNVVLWCMNECRPKKKKKKTKSLTVWTVGKVNWMLIGKGIGIQIIYMLSCKHNLFWSDWKIKKGNWLYQPLETFNVYLVIVFKQSHFGMTCNLIFWFLFWVEENVCLNPVRQRVECKLAFLLPNSTILCCIALC